MARHTKGAGRRIAAAMPQDIVNPKPAAPGASWLEIVRRPTEQAFVAAFAPDAVLDASVVPQRVAGPAAIYRVFDATKSLYNTIGFTHEDVVGGRTYLEWEGRFEDRPVNGETIITRAPNGLITAINLYHRPLAQVVAFAAALSRRLQIP
jgi:hypothetical protein